MLISEIYQSRQGEGLLTGQDSVFIRTSGCNLRCTFCDTPYASWKPEGETMTVEEILERVSGYPAKHVVITGGEPMIVEQLPALTSELKAMSMHITIETAGTVDKQLDCDLMSISPKLSNSTPSLERAGQWRQRHEQRRLNHDAVQSLVSRHDYQLKFVVCQREDVAEIVEFCDQLESVRPERVLLMPEGTEQAVLEQREPWLRTICDEHGFTFCPRMHVAWYGNRRGT